jgi:hypothetical protein
MIRSGKYVKPTANDFPTASENKGALAQALDTGNLYCSDGSEWNPVGTLSSAQVQAVQALVDGSGVDVAFLREHDGAAASYTLDAGSGNVLPVMRVTVEAATDIIAGQRISSGGANTFATTITGASAQGEVIPISVGAGRITRVHLGSSLGASQTVDANGTVTVNEIGRWTCLEADDCNVVYVRFAAPRDSGRYCDVSIVGKRRA